MPRLSNRPPQMRRYAGDKARVSLHGKYHYLGKWGSEAARAAYHRLIEQWRQERALADVPTAARCLVAELAADYIEHLQRYFGRGHNRATSIVPVIKRFGLHFGDLWADEFRPRHLEEAREIWIARKCCRGYVNRAAQDIVRCFQWGVTKDKVPAAVWQSLQAVSPIARGRYGLPEAPAVTAVELDVVDATLPELPAQVADMVRIQLLTGCRPNEIMRMRPGEIDRDGDVWRYRPTLHKNAWRSKPRTVYLGPQAQALLTPYLLRPANQCCFLTGAGKPYARGGYRQVIRRAVERINARRVPAAGEQKGSPNLGEANAEVVLLPHWAPNQLRHAKATELRRMHNLEAARAILGHSSSATTQIYAELNEEPAIDIARKLG